MLSKIILSSVIVAIFCQISHQKSPDYEGCGNTSQCVGMPAKCVDAKSCTVLLKTKPESSGVVDFNLFWSRPSDSNDSWVGAALSTDKMMGNDSATIFIIGSNGVTSEEGLTFVEKSGTGIKAGIKVVKVDGIVVQSSKYEDGLLTAQWTRTQSTTVDTLTFDMKAQKYYILLASGPVKDGQIKHHKNQFVSENAINLESK